MNPTAPQGNNPQLGLPAIPASPNNMGTAALPSDNGLPASNDAGQLPSGPTVQDPNSDDLLTKAITEAKRIEQQYRASPHMQNQALQQLKTNYLNSRYHTNIKLTQN